jgi:hypothetical protein
MSNQDESDKQRTKAFLSSAGYKFRGLKLDAFTPQRQAVASAMGMVWPWVPPGTELEMKVRVKIPEEELKKLPKSKRGDGTRQIKIGHYRASFKDSVIALWLCSVPVSRVDEAEIEPNEAMREAWEWAKKIGLNQGTPVAGEALGLWVQITNEIGDSTGEPVTKGGDEEPEGSGEI